jgi:hypothetical protein
MLPGRIEGTINSCVVMVNRLTKNCGNLYTRPQLEDKEKKMSDDKHFTTEQAREIGDKLGIDWGRLDIGQFRMGLDVELEHGRHDPATDVTGNDPILTGKIALAHLNEFADYYTRLEKMEREAEEELSESPK